MIPPESFQFPPEGARSASILQGFGLDGALSWVGQIGISVEAPFPYPSTRKISRETGDFSRFFCQPTELAHLREFRNTAIEPPPSGPAAAEPAVLKPGVHAAMSLRLAYVVLPWQIPA